MSNRIFTVKDDDQPVYLPGELSRKILLMLDGGSLHQARQVCQGWNEAVLNLVWGQDRAAVERKLKNNWSFAQPLKIEVSIEVSLEHFEFFGPLLTFSGNRALKMVANYQDRQFKIVQLMLSMMKMKKKSVFIHGLGWWPVTSRLSRSLLMNCLMRK